MGRLIRYWNGFLLVLAAALVLTACSDDLSVSNKEVVLAPLGEPTAVVASDELPATSSDESGYLSLNLIVTDDSFQPPAIFIPVGQRVRLVLRNRGSTEHHYRVLELRIRDLLWLAPVDNTADTGEDEEAEHEAHHQATSFVSFRATSPADIRPLGDEVHAYAEAGGGDMVLFTATDTGTFLVHCPLHPEIIGKVIVYGIARYDVSVSPPLGTVATEDPSQASLKSAAILRELVPLLTRTAVSKDGIELEALYQAPALYELTGRTPPESDTSVIAFTVSESVHDGELPEEAIEFVLTVDDKGPFAPLKVRRLSDDPHHRTTEYLFPGKDSDGSPLIKSGHQVLTLSAVPDDPMGIASGTALVWHLPISPSTPSSTLTPVSLTDAQIIQVDGDDKGFNPNRLTLTRGRRVVLIFRNIGSVEHHLHSLEMPVQDVSWYSPPHTHADSPVPSDINTLLSAQFLPYHICDSESGICPTGLDVHLHAPAGDWLAITFIPTTAGTFSMNCTVHPYMKGTIVVK
ncbi:MAG: hypothetical protein Q8O55_00325 [Dehalococcoidales bacterium]|nr:hypothetical protein [Dehalococcoidales bacterium]